MTTNPSNPRRVFLIRGTGSCGTNWMSSLLNLHPRVHACGEWCFAPIHQGVEKWEGQRWTWSANGAMRQTMRRHLAEGVVACLNGAADAENPGAEWIGDRSPEPITDLVPGAPVICMARDGRDVLVSMTCRYLRQDSAKMLEVAPGMTSVRDAYRADPESVVGAPGRLLPDETWVRNRARQWADRIVSDLDAIEQLEEVGTPAMLVRYEDLHAAPITCRDACFRLLGLDPAEAAPISAETKTTPGFDRGEDLGSFYRAGRVSDWRRHFTEDTSRWFSEEAADAMARLDAWAESHPIPETTPDTGVVGMPLRAHDDPSVNDHAMASQRGGHATQSDP